MFGKCRGCQARDEEIRHLLGLLQRSQDLAEKAQGRLSEIVSPGAERRLVLAMAPPKPRIDLPARRQEEPLSSFPGYPPRDRRAAPPIGDDTEGTVPPAQMEGPEPR